MNFNTKKIFSHKITIVLVSLSPFFTESIKINLKINHSTFATTPQQPLPLNTINFSPSSFWPLKAEIACLCAWWSVVTLGPVCLMKLIKKRNLVRTLGFFLEFFPQLILTTGSWDSLPVYLVTCGDHGDHGTSVSDEIDQKTKVGQNTWFFLIFFSPAQGRSHSKKKKKTFPPLVRTPPPPKKCEM